MLKLQRRVGNRNLQRMMSRSLPNGIAGGPVPTEVADGIQAARGRRQPVELGVREAMAASLSELRELRRGSLAARLVRTRTFAGGEPLRSPLGDAAYNAKLSSTNVEPVRVHTDHDANGLTTAVYAIAFTSGRDIVFRSGADTRASDAGQELLAHEPTHLAQQASNLSAEATSRISSPEDPAEREADAVAAGTRAQPAPHDVGPAEATLQRAPVGAPQQAPRTRAVDELSAEDVAGIIAEQMLMWYVASRFGIQNATIEDTKCFW